MTGSWKGRMPLISEGLRGTLREEFAIANQRDLGD
jgi:hypothetical protein